MNARAKLSSGGFWFIWIIFILVIIFLGKGLKLNPQFLPSNMLDKPFPAFQLKSIDSQAVIENSHLLGKPGIVHVWATWCGVCLHEHAAWVEIQSKWQPNIYSVSYKDQPNKVRHWLDQNGDPYRLHLNDPAGTLGLDLGLTGTPETYVFDSQGLIRFHHIGPINSEIFKRSILPILNQQEEKVS